MPMTCKLTLNVTKTEFMLKESGQRLNTLAPSPYGDNDLVLGLNRLQLKNHWDYLASKFSQRNTSYHLGTPRTNLMFYYHAQIIWNSLPARQGVQGPWSRSNAP